MKRCFIMGLCVISVMLNIIFLMPYTDVMISYCDRMISPSNYEHLDSDISDSDYIDLIVRRSMKMAGDNFSTKEYYGLFKDLKMMNYKSHNEILTNPFNIGYLYCGLSYYALYNGEKTEVVEFLKNISIKYENESKNGLNYNISAITQIPIGIMYINLFRMTKEKKYLQISNSIYRQLLTFRIKGGRNSIFAK